MGVIVPQQTVRLSRSTADSHRMRLRYGLSENSQWSECKSACEVRARVRQAAAQIVRLSVESDCPASGSWQCFETYVDGLLAAGALPMVTFSKFGRPYDDPAAIRWFAGYTSGLVRRSVDRWGPDAVREWFWCLGDQPNSDWLNSGLTFDYYRSQYEAAAEGVLDCLAPYLEGRKALIGGPGIDSFQPFWMDWVYRFVNEIDNWLISFVMWHRYGDWRQPGDWGAPQEQDTFRALLMSRSTEYETRARAVGRMLKGRSILNLCGELNAHSDHYGDLSRLLNRTEFGAAYYASALIHLMRGGADMELLRSAAPGDTPQHLAKQLCIRFVRAGDELAFPEPPNARGADIVLATGPCGEFSAFVVNRREDPFTLALEDLPLLEQCSYRYQIDTATNGTIAEGAWRDELRINGYGVGVLTNQEAASR